MTGFADFFQNARGADAIAQVRAGVVGEGLEIDGPYGPRKLIYADYTASGRALDQVEDVIRREILPHYANSHTEDSYCGRKTTRLREDARAYVGQCLNAGPDDEIIFVGAGVTGAINKLVGLLGLQDAPRMRPAPVSGSRPISTTSALLSRQGRILEWCS